MPVIGRKATSLTFPVSSVGSDVGTERRRESFFLFYHLS